MKKVVYLFLGVLMLSSLTACDKTESYAEQKEKERETIRQFIAKSSITTITEAEFAQQNYTTDVAKNQYVLFTNSGVYMQIIDEGCGEKLQSGETAEVICRFRETNLMADSIVLTNNVMYYASLPDRMNVSYTGGTYSASFVRGLMKNTYNDASVPSGWLVALPYIKLGRPANQEEGLARVKLIVPHSEGNKIAKQAVYPCFYEITYQRGR